MPIVLAPLNTEMRITRISVDEKTKRHLENLGILVNSEVTVLANGKDNVIVKIKESRLALNRETAMKIMVA